MCIIDRIVEALGKQSKSKEAQREKERTEMYRKWADSIMEGIRLEHENDIRIAELRSRK